MDLATEAIPAARKWTSAAAVVALGFSLLWGLSLLALIAHDDLPLRHRLGEVVPMAVIVLSQAALAALGGIRRRGTLVAAGIVGLPLTMVSFAGVGFPYLIPSILFFVAAARSPAAGSSNGQALIGLAIAAALVAAFILMLADTEVRCWTRERVDGETRVTVTTRSGTDAGSMYSTGGSGGCSEVTSPRSAARSTVLSLAAIGGGGLLLRRSARRGAS